MTILLRIVKQKKMVRNGQRKKNFDMTLRSLMIRPSPRGSVFGVASSLYPHSANALYHARRDFISCATWAGVFAVLVAANRSDPYSTNFLMHG
jgi:hypothetical protein